MAQDLPSVTKVRRTRKRNPLGLIIRARQQGLINNSEFIALGTAARVGLPLTLFVLQSMQPLEAQRVETELHMSLQMVAERQAARRDIRDEKLRLLYPESSAAQILVDPTSA